MKRATFDRDTFAQDTLLPPDTKALNDLRDLLGMFASFRADYDKVDGRGSARRRSSSR